jgi:hypothetical protein
LHFTDNKCTFVLQDLQLANTTLANELVRLQSTGGEVCAVTPASTALPLKVQCCPESNGRVVHKEFCYVVAGVLHPDAFAVVEHSSS